MLKGTHSLTTMNGRPCSSFMTAAIKPVFSESQSIQGFCGSTLPCDISSSASSSSQQKSVKKEATGRSGVKALNIRIAILQALPGHPGRGQ